MALDSISKLGQKLGGTQRDVEELQQNVSPDEVTPIDNIRLSESIRFTGTLTVSKLRMSNIWQVGHPEFGVITDDDGYIDEEQTLMGYLIGPWCILSHPVWCYLDDCLLSDENEDVYEKTFMSEYDIHKNVNFALVLNPVTNITNNSADAEAELVEV
jgi:hypothetical protein